MYTFKISNPKSKNLPLSFRTPKEYFSKNLELYKNERNIISSTNMNKTEALKIISKSKTDLLNKLPEE
jgi:hypothetical protein